MPTIGEFDEFIKLGDRTIKPLTLPFFKGEKDRTYRLALVSPKIASGFVHTYVKFLDGTHKNVMCLGEGGSKICCIVLGESVRRFAAVVWVYDTSKDGKLISPNSEELSGQLMIFRLTASKYQQLTALADEFPINSTGAGEEQCDIIAKCDVPEFQKFTFTPAKEAHFKRNSDWFSSVNKDVASAEKKLKPSLGVVMSEEEIEEQIVGRT